MTQSKELAENGSVVLSLDNITKRFGSLVANDDLSLSLKRGEILALLGENGAGKTTLMNVLFGHYVPEEGAIHIADDSGILHELPQGSPSAALDAGVGMVHQHFTLAENLTGFDNIVLGTESLWQIWRSRSALRKRIEAIMRESGLTVDLDVKTAQLSVGEKQRIEILKALYRDVRVLILDEPTAVLTPQEADGLFVILRRLAASGLGVIFISHKLGEVLAVSHRIAVLRGGKKAGELMTASADKRSIADMMVGRTVPPLQRKASQIGATVLEFDHVSLKRGSVRQSLSEVSFAIKAGEIVGLAGVSGNGQSGIAALVSGLETVDKGAVRLYGKPMKTDDPRALVAAGVARMPEDRQHDGVVGSMSVAENIAIEDLHSKEFQSAGFINRKAMRQRAGDAIKAYDIRCQGPDAQARLLSGGNIQKLILARVLERSPKLILANQPTRGLDIGAQTEVHQRILAARDRGAGVLLISEDLDELFALSDRLLVMHTGEVTDAGPVDGLDRGSVGMMMAGHAVQVAS